MGPHGQVGSDRRKRPDRTGSGRGGHEALAAGIDAGDSVGTGGSAVERRNRYIRQSVDRDQCAGWRQEQRRRACRRSRSAGQGDRGGRQPRRHCSGKNRVQRQRRSHQHRRHRQLGRRRLLRSRSEHQDSSRFARAFAVTAHAGTESVAGVDVRRRGGAGVGGQHCSERAARNLPRDRFSDARCSPPSVDGSDQGTWP